MKLNQDYVMSEAAYTEGSKKKEAEQVETLYTNLKYNESYIATLKMNAVKQEERDMNEVVKKTKENTYLVVELNQTKLELKQLERINKELQIRKH